VIRALIFDLCDAAQTARELAEILDSKNRA